MSQNNVPDTDTLESFDSYVEAVLSEREQRRAELVQDLKPEGIDTAKIQVIYLVKRLKAMAERLHFLNYYFEKKTFHTDMPNGEAIFKKVLEDTRKTYENFRLDLELYYEENDEVILKFSDSFKATALEFLNNTPQHVAEFVQNYETFSTLLLDLSNRELFIPPIAKDEKSQEYTLKAGRDALKGEVMQTYLGLKSLDKRQQKIKKIEKMGMQDELARIQFARVVEISKVIYYQYLVTNDDIEDNKKLRDAFAELDVVCEKKDRFTLLEQQADNKKEQKE